MENVLDLDAFNSTLLDCWEEEANKKENNLNRNDDDHHNNASNLLAGQPTDDDDVVHHGWLANESQLSSFLLGEDDDDDDENNNSNHHNHHGDANALAHSNNHRAGSLNHFSHNYDEWCNSNNENSTVSTSAQSQSSCTHRDTMQQSNLDNLFDQVTGAMDAYASTGSAPSGNTNAGYNSQQGASFGQPLTDGQTTASINEMQNMLYSLAQQQQNQQQNQQQPSQQQNMLQQNQQQTQYHNGPQYQLANPSGNPAHFQHSNSSNVHLDTGNKVSVDDNNSNNVTAPPPSTLLTTEVQNAIPLVFTAVSAGVDLSQFFNSNIDPNAVASLASQYNSDSGTGVSGSGGSNNMSQANSGNNAPGMSVSSPRIVSNNISAIANGINKGLVANNDTMSINNEIHTQQRAVSDSTLSNHDKRRKNASQASSVPTKRRATGKGKSSGSTADELPPFKLFDAPIELRQNYMNAQKAYGLPVLNDDNSEHYKISASDKRRGDSNKYENVKLVGTTEDIGSKRLKNAKEQKRAQRITELIEQLRVKMESSGWKTGIKSKLTTLCSCAEYVKHLVKTNKEKEEAVKQAKNNLDAKRKLIEDDNAQQNPSDPESTTSSLTIDASSGKESSGDNGKKSHSKDSRKRRASQSEPDKISSKKVRSSLTESNVSALHGAKSGQKGYGGITSVNVDQNVSTTSELTDSNKGSSSGSDEAQSKHASDRGDTASSGSVDSNAAVISGQGSEMPSSGHSDVIIHNSTRKSNAYAKDKIGRSFRLDYEEIFVRSNVPQLIASPQGKIVAWNDFFTCVTGSSKREIKRLTIFSLVKITQLHKLFDILATALRETQTLTDDSAHASDGVTSGGVTDSDGGRTDQGDADNDNSSSDNDSRQRQGDASKPAAIDYQSVTLPCVEFKNKITGATKYSLYMTVTLMDDADPRKRCFHCALTNTQYARDGIGPMSPDYLSIFTQKRFVLND